MNSGDCDCGTCCNACGHTDDCIRNTLDNDTTNDQDYDRDAYQIA